MIRTLGCFRIYTQNHSKGKTNCQWALLFENLGCVMPRGMVSSDMEIYDLKGTFNDRRYVKKSEKKQYTKMDKNFLEDFHGLPITISKASKKLLDMSIWNDTLFLAKQNIVDYSILLIISPKYRVLTVGIIDYIAKYNLEKLLENKIKGENATVIKPNLYKNRFRDTISNKIFLELED